MPGKVLSGRESDTRSVISNYCCGEGHVVTRPSPVTVNMQISEGMLVKRRGTSMPFPFKLLQL